jgi:hypothetical protein
MPPTAPSFEQLEHAVSMIARHPDYPGKERVVVDCLDDIEDRWTQGKLNLQLRFRLYATLLQGCRTSPHQIGDPGPAA